MSRRKSGPHQMQFQGCQNCLQRDNPRSSKTPKRAMTHWAGTSNIEKWSHNESSVNEPQHDSPLAASINYSTCGKQVNPSSTNLEPEGRRPNTMTVSRSNSRPPKEFHYQWHEGTAQSPDFGSDIKDCFSAGINSLGFDTSPVSSHLLSGTADKWSLPTLQDELFPTDSQGDGFPVENGDQLSDLLPAESYSKSAPLSNKEALPKIEPCSRHRKSCMVSALKILQTLHTTPSVCFSAGVDGINSDDSQLRTTDTVLSVNRQIIELVSHVLNCACFESFQLQLILVIICSKLSVWYRAMMPRHFPCSEDTITSFEETSKRMLHQPITVGNYAIDDTIEHRIRAQVILGELQKFENLIKRVCRRLQETKQHDTSSTAPMRGLHAPVCSSNARLDKTNATVTVNDSLTRFLHEQLQAAKTDIEVILNNGSSGVDMCEQNSNTER